MKWSVPLGRVMGIQLFIHWSFLLIVGWVGWLGWRTDGWVASLWAVLLVLTLFLCVILHELGHSLVALKFGIHVRDITLFPIGGVASMSSIPEKPGQEFLMALAGPLVNVIIAGLLLAVRRGVPAFDTEAVFPTNWQELVDQLIRINIVLVLFNLLPIFPMDGGRVMRAILGVFMSHARATAVAAAIGRLLALGLIILGLRLVIYNPFLVIIGIFIFIGAGNENRWVQIRAKLRGVCMRDVMLSPCVSLHPDDPVKQCKEYAIRTAQDSFPVVDRDSGLVIGVVPHKSWKVAVKTHHAETLVATIMLHQFICFNPDAPVDELFRDMRRLRQGIYPIVENGCVIGILRREDVERYLRYSALLPKRGRRDLSEAGNERGGYGVDFG